MNYQKLTKQIAIDRLKDWAKVNPGQVINPDIDGILSALLLHKHFGWPVIGYYDTKKISISREVANVYFLGGKLDLSRIVWTDLDISIPGAQSIGQHIVNWDDLAIDDIYALSASINPNLHDGWFRSGQIRYKDKYPFGTAQYVAFLLDSELNQRARDSKLLEGLMWMPDGGAWSLSNFEKNCIDWATNFLLDGALSYSALDESALVRSLVENTQKFLASKLPELTWSKTSQPNLVLPSGGGYKSGLDPTTFLGRDIFQSLVDECATILGQESLKLPDPEFDSWDGDWRQLTAKPDSWHGAVNSGRVVSHALTTMRSFSVTLPSLPNSEVPQIADILDF
jgi:hypothetical protein